MKDLLIDTLEPLGFPIFQQGSLGPDEPYPESFFTFWNNDASGGAFYDNEENQYVWDFDLNLYSSDPDVTNTKLLTAKSLLKAAGFVVNGAGYDVPSDEPTHTGRGIHVLKIQPLKEEEKWKSQNGEA